MSAPPGPEVFDAEFAVLAGSRLLPPLWREAYGEEHPARLRVFSPTTWTDQRVAGRSPCAPGRRWWTSAPARAGRGCGSRRSRAPISSASISRSTPAPPRPAAHPSSCPRGGPVSSPVPSRPPAYPTRARTACAASTASSSAPTRRPARPRSPGSCARATRVALLVSEVLDPAEAGPARVVDYRPLLEGAGLRVLRHEDKTDAPERLRRLYGLWLEHADELRADLGTVAAKSLLDETRTVGARLDRFRDVRVAAERT